MEAEYARVGLYGSNRYNMETIRKNLKYLNLSESVLVRIERSLKALEPIYITGPPGPNGRTHLVEVLNGLGLNAVLVPYDNLIVLNKETMKDDKGNYLY